MLPHSITVFLRRDTRGSVTVIFAISILFIMMTAGFAIDYVRWQRDQTQLQSVVDAAVLAAVQEVPRSGWTQAGMEKTLTAFMNPNGAGLDHVTVDSIAVDRVKNTLKVVASMSGGRSFSSILLKADPKLVAGSTAVAGGGTGTPVCVLALDGSMSKALSASGGGTRVNANQCSVKVNSNSSAAVNFSGGSAMNSAENCFVGGVGQGLAYISPSPVKCDPVPDPFASLALPAIPSSCAAKNSYSGSASLNPGLYCGGLTLSSGTFNLAPGLYVIRDGLFTVSGGSTMIGNGVTFLLMGNNAGVNWSGGTGSYQLKAMSTGPLAGFIVYLDPKATPASKSVISGGGNTTYEGVYYFPRQLLELSGGSTAATPSPFTAFVANNFLFSGGSALNIYMDRAKTTVPIPAVLLGGAIRTRLTH